MYRTMPLGLSDESPPPEGTAPYAGSTIPGPIGTVADEVGHPSAMHPPGVAINAGLDGSISLPFAVGADTYRLRQTNADWRPTSYEVAIPPQEAGVILEQAAAQHRQNLPLLRVLETAASHLAGLDLGGTFVLVLLRPYSASSVAASASPAPPASIRRAAPLEVPDVVEELVFPASVAAAQAAILKEAAISGVPFCEECARRAAQRAAETAA